MNFYGLTDFTALGFWEVSRDFMVSGTVGHCRVWMVRGLRLKGFRFLGS